MRRVGLIGGQVLNSLSPAIHNFLFEKYGVRGEYGLFNVEPDKLESTIYELVELGYTGFNVTTPYKESIIPLLHEVDYIAREIGAVNTVWIKSGKMIGYNTDCYGFLQGIKCTVPDIRFNEMTALIFGAGGASRAILYALNDEKIKHIYLCNRTFSKAQNLSKEFKNVTPILWEERENILCKCDLIVNTTTLSTHFINLINAPHNAIINDIIYYPTDLLQQRNGINGLSMLIWQADLSFRIWFDKCVFSN